MRLPEWLEPMAATLTAERFVDPAWTFERKLDGIRMLAFKNAAGVRLYSRNRLPLTVRTRAWPRPLPRCPSATRSSTVKPPAPGGSRGAPTFTSSTCCG